MILYGLVNYGNRRPKGKESVLFNRYIGYVGFEKYSEWKELNMKCDRDVSCTYVRGAEKILGLTYGSLPWKSHIDNKKDFKAVQTGIYNFQPNSEEFSDIPPFNNRANTVCCFNFADMEDNIQFFNGQNNDHKVYFLLVLAALTHIGNRMFYSMAENPAPFAEGYEELNAIKNFINRHTKLSFTYKHSYSKASTGIKDRLKCDLNDLTSSLLESYSQFLVDHKSLHMSDVVELKKVVGNMYRTIKMVE